MTTLLLGMLGGLLAAKLAFGWRRRAWMMHGGGCGRMHRHADGRDFGPRSRRQGWGRPVQLDAPEVVTSVLGKLDSNGRQRDEANEVFAAIADALGPAYRRWDGLGEALALVSADAFDAARARELFDGARAAELADGLEHLHTILTAEQRERLGETLGRRAV